MAASRASSTSPVAESVDLQVCDLVTHLHFLLFIAFAVLQLDLIVGW